MSDYAWLHLKSEAMDRLEREHGEWEARNFPNKKAHHGMLGMVEEVGELCHAVLKRSQGIRGSEEEHLAEIMDAVGDIAIFAQSVIGSAEESIRSIEEVDNMTERNVMEIAEACTWSVSALIDSKAQWLLKARTVGVIKALMKFCKQEGIDFEACVNSTWDRVKQRDWIADPTNGINGDTPRQYNPSCKNCGARLLRWGWFEAESEPVEYWYCEDCDRNGLSPYIQVHPTRKKEGEE